MIDLGSYTATFELCLKRLPDVDEDYPNQKTADAAVALKERLTSDLEFAIGLLLKAGEWVPGFEKRESEEGWPLVEGRLSWNDWYRAFALNNRLGEVFASSRLVKVEKDLKAYVKALGDARTGFNDGTERLYDVGVEVTFRLKLSVLACNDQEAKRVANLVWGRNERRLDRIVASGKILSANHDQHATVSQKDGRGSTFKCSSCKQQALKEDWGAGRITCPNCGAVAPSAGEAVKS